MRLLSGSIGDWKTEPFSYLKLCSAVSIWFGLISFLLIPDIGGYPHFWLGIWGVVSYAFQKFSKLVVWRLLVQPFKDSIPYDRTEAAAGKGTIHSYPDLWRWIIGYRGRSSP